MHFTTCGMQVVSSIGIANGEAQPAEVAAAYTMENEQVDVERPRVSLTDCHTNCVDR
jgi:hypothetical protein